MGAVRGDWSVLEGWGISRGRWGSLESLQEEVGHNGGSHGVGMLDLNSAPPFITAAVC